MCWLHGTASPPCALRMMFPPQNGLLSSLSYLFAYICGMVAGQMADFLLSRKIFSVVNVRKLFSTLGKEESGQRSPWGVLRPCVQKHLTVRFGSFCRDSLSCDLHHVPALPELQLLQHHHLPDTRQLDTHLVLLWTAYQCLGYCSQVGLS